MGGNALKHLDVTRVTPAEYGRRLAAFHLIAMQIQDENPEWEFQFGIPMPVKGKESYGDLDIIYHCNANEFLINHLKRAFESLGFKKNGPVTSIEWKGFQVDMIFTPQDSLEWSTSWYSHGDYAAVLGRVFRYYGFKLCNDGLYFSLSMNHQKKDFLVTKDWKIANWLLGYKAVSREFMYTEQELYEQLLTSEYMNKEIYEIMQADRKTRPFQVGFYAYVATTDVAEKGDRLDGYKQLVRYYRRIAWQIAVEYVIMKFRAYYLVIKKPFKKVWHKHIKVFLLKASGAYPWNLKQNKKS